MKLNNWIIILFIFDLIIIIKMNKINKLIIKLLLLLNS